MITAVSLATIITSLALLSLTIAAELQPALKDWLQTFFYHHWIGKSLIASVVFVLVTLAARFLPKVVSARWSVRAVWGVVLSAGLVAISILGFFSYEYFLA